MPSFSEKFVSYSCKLGGDDEKVFKLSDKFSHSSPATKFVSSSRGFFSTDGNLSFNFKNNDLNFVWNLDQCSPLCLLDYGKNYTRLSFSICEYDESSKESEKLSDFEVNLSP